MGKIVVRAIVCGVIKSKVIFSSFVRQHIIKYCSIYLNYQIHKEIQKFDTYETMRPSKASVKNKPTFAKYNSYVTS